MRSAWNQGDELGSLAVIKKLTHGKAIMEMKTVDTGTWVEEGSTIKYKCFYWYLMFLII